MLRDFYYFSIFVLRICKASNKSLENNGLPLQVFTYGVFKLLTIYSILLPGSLKEWVKYLCDSSYTMVSMITAYWRTHFSTVLVVLFRVVLVFHHFGIRIVFKMFLISELVVLIQLFLYKREIHALSDIIIMLRTCWPTIKSGCSRTTVLIFKK